MNSRRVFLSISVALVAGLVIGVFIAGAGENSQQQSAERYPVDLSLAGQHRHDLKMVPADQAPSVDIEVQGDPMMSGHFNLHIETDNFEFAPENVSSEHVLGEGHAHVFVDDVKISRAYGSWYHLPRLEPGEHIIKVTLNTNDHQEYATENEFIFDTETVTVSEGGGMGMSTSSAATTTAE